MNKYLYVALVFSLVGTFAFPKAFASQNFTHKEWSNWQYPEWSECQVNDELKVAELQCGVVEGTQERTPYRVCENKNGWGQNECNTVGFKQYGDTQKQGCEIDYGECVTPTPTPTPTPEITPTPVITPAVGHSSHTGDKCDLRKPELVTWAAYDSKTSTLNWAEEGADKVELRFGPWANFYPFHITLDNTGHTKVGLGTKIGFWLNWYELRGLNGCRKGDWRAFN